MAHKYYGVLCHIFVSFSTVSSEEYDVDFMKQSFASKPLACIFILHNLTSQSTNGRQCPGLFSLGISSFPRLLLLQLLSLHYSFLHRLSMGPWSAFPSSTWQLPLISPAFAYWKVPDFVNYSQECGRVTCLGADNLCKLAGSINFMWRGNSFWWKNLLNYTEAVLSEYVT